MTGVYDNWEHRSINMRCSGCMWFAPKAEPVQHTKDGSPVNEARAPIKGRCRRHAPTLAGWPVVFETDWCGDHKLA